MEKNSKTPERLSDTPGRIKKSMKSGPTHSDTILFDDLKLLNDQNIDILNTKIVKIKFWHGTLMPSGVVNGIQLTFKDLDTGKMITTEPRYGSHQLKGTSEYTLEEREHITKAVFSAGGVMDRVEFHTNKGKVIRQGGIGGTPQVFDVGNEGNYEVVGVFGGYGGHIHNLGIYYAESREIVYAKRKSFIMLKEHLKNHKLQLDNDEFLAKRQNTEYRGCFAFVLCTRMSTQIFHKVLTYLV